MKKNKTLQQFAYFIIYIMVGFIPHIYRYSVHITNPSEKIYFKNETYADLYILVKSKVFLILIAILSIIFVYQIIKRQIIFKKDLISIFTFCFAFIIVLSSLFSKYQDIVYWGTKDRFEGMWVWLGYTVLFTIVRYYANDERFVERILKVFVCSASIMSIFGIMQVQGYDIYTEGPLRWLAFPSNMAANIDAFMTKNATIYGAVGALYSSNYFGVFVAAATLIALVFSLDKNIKIKIGYSGLFLLNYFAMIASRAEAALLGFTVAIFVMIILYRNKIDKNRGFLLIIFFLTVFVDRFMSKILIHGQSGNVGYIYKLMIISIIIGIFLSYFFEKKDKFRNVIFKYSLPLSIIVLVIGIITFNISLNFIPSSPNPDEIEELYIEENNLNIKLAKREKIKIEFLVNGINAYNENNEIIKIETDPYNNVYIKAENQDYFLNFTKYDNGYLVKIRDPLEVYFFFDSKKLKYVNSASGVGDIEHPDRFEYYFSKGRILSDRGYIWATYLPIIMDNALLGSGLDTYLETFPQNDYIGKHNEFLKSNSSIIVDKPHSIYFMIFSAMGFFGLILFMMLVLEIIHSFLIQIETKDEKSILIVVVVVILISGIFNDSTIPLTIILSCFSGMAFKTN